jgi:hypothetical protein
MASSSDNQGLQIAVIIFALLTIIMSGATFYVFKLNEDAQARLEAANKTAQEANASLAQAVGEINEMKQAISSDLNIESKHDAVKAKIAADMAAYASTLPAEQQNYSTALQEFSKSLQLAQAERVKEADEIKQMKDQLASIQDTNKKTEAEYQEKAKTALDETRAAEQKSAEAQKKLNDEKAELASQIQSEKEKAANAEAEMQKIATKAEADNKKAEALLAQAGDQIKELTDADFAYEKSDGQITWVSARTGKVWINRGSADGLQKQVSFAIFGADQNGVARSESKGKVEVTEILGEHLAEARIVEDKITDPIMLNDHVYTPLWQPGRAEHFAIAGKLDIDGDNVTDAPFIKDLIRRNGAVLDAELLPDGTINGEMGISTRYLILGEPFSAEAAEKNYSAMQAAAAHSGAEILPVQKFLDFMGWADTSKVVQFGANADPKDFQYNPNETRASRRTPTNASQFRRRDPPGAGGGASTFDTPLRKQQ